MLVEQFGHMLVEQFGHMLVEQFRHKYACGTVRTYACGTVRTYACGTVWTYACGTVQTARKCFPPELKHLALKHPEYKFATYQSFTAGIFYSWCLLQLAFGTIEGVCLFSVPFKLPQ